jgi:hypothetical protein
MDMYVTIYCFILLSLSKTYVICDRGGKIFRKIEPYLTFLNVHQLERQGADIQSKVEELKEVNQSLRDRDKMKDDAIAQLSDQLVALSGRLQDIERRQGSGLAAGITV